MHLHVIRHVPFEGPGLIARWAVDRGHTVSDQLALTVEFPPLDDVDMLVLMGGPMAADDHARNPWLPAEKTYAAAAADAGRLVFGACLGAQIIADALGGTVQRNPQPEIGWFPVHRTGAADSDPVFSAFPEGLVVGHWHGDTFTLPEGVVAALSSEACANQAFSARDGRVVGLQFHLEWTAEGLADLAEKCVDELEDGGAWVSDAPTMLAQAEEQIPLCAQELYAVLDRMAAAREGQ